jgi:AraC-like DNA-binding protein
LHELLQAFCTKLRAHANHWDYCLIRVKGGVQLRRRSSPIDVGSWPVEQYVVSYLIDLVRMAAQKSWHPSEIWLQHSGDLLAGERTWLAASKLHFNSPWTAIYVPQRLLALPLRSQIESSTSTYNYSEFGKSVASDLRRLLRTLLTEDQHRIANVADLVGTSPRTLQRALHRCGTSYQQVLNGARFDLAREKLMHGHLSITDVAYDVGFSEAASFSKAFRKWAGISPREYRATTYQDC